MSTESDENEKLIDYSHGSSTLNEKTEVESEQIERKFQSVSSCIFNFVNTSLGSGVLTIPYNFSVSGYVIGTLINLTFCFLSGFSYYLLVKASNYTKQFQYHDITKSILPTWIGWIATGSSMIFSLGCLISYVIVIRDNFFFFSAKYNFTPSEITLYSDLLVAGIMVLFIMPLCYLPSLESLKFNSILIMAVIAYILFAVIYTFADHMVQGLGIHHTVVPVVSGFSMLEAFSLTTQAYNAQYNFLNLYMELRDRKKSAPKVIVGNLGIITTIYFIIGVFGYITYGEDTQSNILKNLAEEGSVLAYIANILMIVLMICHYPLPVYSLRLALESLIWNIQSRPKRWHSILISTILVLCCTGIAIPLKSIDNILDFTASLAGGILGFIMPAIYIWRLGVIRNKISFQVQGIIMGIVGFTITALGFGMACYKWIGPLFK